MAKTSRPEPPKPRQGLFLSIASATYQRPDTFATTTRAGGLWQTWRKLLRRAQQWSRHDTRER